MLGGKSLTSLPIVVTEGVVKIDPADLGGKKGTHYFTKLFFTDKLLMLVVLQNDYTLANVYPGL